MTDEYNALIVNKTWLLVPRTSDMHVIRSMWIFKHKLNFDGSFERYKARLVGDGRSQQVGIDCEDTFSPIVKPATICTVLSLALSKSWAIHQLDVKNAILHGILNETIYMHQPMGFRDSSYPNHVCLLKKLLYGLKQASRAWYQRFAEFVSTIGFVDIKCDYSLFIYRRGRDVAYLLLYVDDIILTTSTTSLRKSLMACLSYEFAMKDLGPLSYFLGVAVSRTRHSMFLSQTKYAKEIIERTGMSSCKPAHTSVDTSRKLSTSSGDTFLDPTYYCSLVGALQYLTFTRPDICYAVQQICLHMHDPRDGHMQALKRIIHYLQRTLSYGSHLSKTANHSLPTTSKSSAEAEYRGVANVVFESCWLRNLLLELHCPVSKATLVYCDNVSAIYLSGNAIQHQRVKHIELDIHFVREHVARGQVRVLHVPSRYQLDDIFTKGLSRVRFDDFRDSLNIRPPTASTAGDY
nr:copia protein [Tanacetum cinerariifolium]